MIYFTKHAKEKFLILHKHKIFVSRKFVLETLNDPELIDNSKSQFKIAQREFDKWRVLRVVYKEKRNKKIIITFYPGKKSQYEKK